MKNTFVKVLSFVMALMMVVGTFGTLAVFAADHEHTKGTLVEKKDPTCLKSGYSVYVCGVEGCGEEWTTDLVLANAKYHNYEDKAAEEATCSSNAKPAATVCSHCGKTPDGKDRPEIPNTKLDHNFVGKIVEATCSTNKKLVHTCSLCGKTAAELLGANNNLDKDLGGAANLDHKEADKLSWAVVTAPSQTATECLPGLAQCTCTKCGEIVDTVEIPADHTWVDLNEKDLPCIEWNKGVMACDVCGKLQNPDAQKRETSGHNVVLVIGTTATEIAGLTEDDYKYTVDAKNPPEKLAENGVTKVDMTIAELAEHGFANGSKLHKAAKCNEKGSALVQCSCGEVYVKEIGETSHNWGDGWKLNTLNADTVKCTDAITKSRKCSVCQVEEHETLKAAVATAHNLVVDEDRTQIADCDSIGYTVKVCQNATLLGIPCKYVVEENHKDALGHTWGTPVLKSGDCLDGVYQKTCTVCGATDSANRPDSITAHRWNEKASVDATCLEVSYKYISCKDCGYWKAADGTAVVAGSADGKTDKGTDKNADKHVYATEAQMKAFVNATTWTEGTNGIIGYAAGTTSTCTSAGKLTVKCTNANCAQKNTIITVNAPLKDHDIRTGLSKIEYKDGKLVVNTTTTTDIPTSCTAAGADNDGKACFDCTYVEKRPTVIALDPDAHAYDSSKPIFTATATCMTPGYKQYNATCTHGVITVIEAEGMLAAHKYTKDNGSVNWIDAKAAECLEDGNHKYIGCVWCKEIKPGTESMLTSIADCGCRMTGDGAAQKHADLAASGNYVIPATGHDYEEIKIDREECDKAGVAAHLDCKNCNYKKLGETEYDYSNADAKKAFDLAAAIPAHYGQYTTKFDKKAATCTERGISETAAAKSYCTVCDVVNGVGKWLDIPALNHMKGDVSMKKDMPINLVFDASTGKYLLKDCTKDGAIVTVCSGCGAAETDFVYATNTEHKYADTWVDDVVPTGTQTCYVTATEKKTCTVPGCEAKITQTKENGAATGHYTTKGIKNGEKFFFEYDCTKIDDYKEFSCDKCGTKYTDLLTAGVDGLEGDAKKATIQAVKHDIIDLKQDATCTEDGYIVKECRNCEWINAEKTPYGLADTKNEIIPNKGGHKKTGAIVLEDLAPTLEQDGRFVYICAECGETITEIKSASFAIDSVIAPEYAIYSAGNKINAIVSISANEFTFNTLTIEVDSALELVEVEMLAKFDVNVSAYINADHNVVVFAEDTLSGDFQNATFAGGEDVAFVMLTFATSKLVTGDFTMATEITEAEFYTADEAESFEKIVLVDVAEDETAKVSIANPGNFNNDSNIDARDLASFLPALANAVLMGTVENKYDLNNDGKVDFDDVAGLRAYIADGQSLKSYLAMTGEDIDAALAANSAPSITGNANNDKVLFDAAMKAVIESGEFTTADYIELCKTLKVDTLEDVIRGIIKIAIQEAAAEPNPENRDVRFTVDTVYIRVLKGDVFEIVEISY